MALFLFCLVTSGLVASLLLGSAQAEERGGELPDEIYREVMSSCIASMGKNIVSNPVAKAYCFCYVDQLGKTMTEADFTRMDNYGASDFDKERFQAATKRCKPKWSLFKK